MLCAFHLAVLIPFFLILSLLCLWMPKLVRSTSVLHHSGGLVAQPCLILSTPWLQPARLLMEFSRQEYWFPPPGDLPHPGIGSASLVSPALADKFFTTSATWMSNLGRKWVLFILLLN